MASKHLCTDPAEHAASNAGAKAWDYLKKVKAREFGEWQKIGDAFQIGRAWARREVGISPDARLPVTGNMAKPVDYRLGRPYNEKFGEWLIAYKMDDIDQAARSNLLKLTDNPAIVAWRNGLPKDRRDNLNHPTTILRAYKQAQKKLEPAPADDEVKKTSKQSALEAAGDAYQALRTENVKLREAATKRCEVDILHSDMADIEKWLRTRILSEHKARRLRDVLNELYPPAKT